jgi:hypothetical protein
MGSLGHACLTPLRPDNKGCGRSAVEQRDDGGDLLLADAKFLGDAQVDRLNRSRAMI